MYAKPNIHLISTRRTVKAQQGIVLVESLIAIVIFSMGILALIGLQAAMVSNTTASKYRGDANYIVQQKLGELWTDPDHVAASPVDDPVPSLPNGKCNITIPGPDQVKIVVTWQQPGETEVHNVTTNARIPKGI